MNKQFRLALVSIASLSLFGACGDKKEAQVEVKEVTVVEHTREVPADENAVRESKELMEQQTVVEDLAS